MSKHSETIRWAYNAGFRVHADGSLVSPSGRRRKSYVQPKKPYPQVTISIDGKHRHFYVHRFAAYQRFGEAALAPGVQVRHLDSNSENNAPSNLALGSPSENAFDRHPDERRRLALNAAKAKRLLTDEQARELVRLSREERWTGRRLAEHFGLFKSQVSEILSGKLYSEATGLAQRPRRNALNPDPSPVAEVA